MLTTVLGDTGPATAPTPSRRSLSRSSRWKMFCESTSRKVNGAVELTPVASTVHTDGVTLLGAGTAGAGGWVQVRNCNCPLWRRSSVQTRLPVFVVRYSTYASPATVPSLLIAEAYRICFSSRMNAVVTCDSLALHVAGKVFVRDA